METGVWTTRWKAVQTKGRLARDPRDRGVFITVVEENHRVRGIATENASMEISIIHDPSQLLNQSVRSTN